LDVTVGMAYSLLSVYAKPKKRISAAAALLRGYNSVYPVLPGEMPFLSLLMLTRLACSVTLGAYSYQQNPQNEYLLFHAAPAWDALESLWGYDEVKRRDTLVALDGVWERACRYSEVDAPVIDCHDLCFPDPSVIDPLASVRVTQEASVVATTMSTASAPATIQSPDSKKAKTKPTITFVTGNKKKLEEVQRILATDMDTWFDLDNAKLDLPELQGDVMTIAKEKCKLAAQQVNGPVMTEDTSLCFDALNGLPGPYIKWFLESCGHDGLNLMLHGFETKAGYAQTVVALCMGPDKEPVVFDGQTRGVIVPPRGSLDFGWDPIFEPDEGGGKTYAEMRKEEKDAISHRSRAFAKLREYLNGDAAKAAFGVA
jgi:inosine triphosphate pyrophosphatase